MKCSKEYRDSLINNELLKYSRPIKAINNKTKIFNWSYEQPKEEHSLIDGNQFSTIKQWPAEWVIRSILRRFEDLSNINFVQTAHDESILIFHYTDKLDGIFLDSSFQDIYEFESYILSLIHI